MLAFRRYSLYAALLLLFSLVLSLNLNAQSGGVTGVVADPTGAVIPNATVAIHNPVSGFSRTTITDGAGRFSIPNVPFNPYHVTVTMKGFNTFARDIDVRSVVPVNVPVTLGVKSMGESVTVEGGGDLIENDFALGVPLDIHDRLGPGGNATHIGLGVREQRAGKRRAVIAAGGNP